MWLLAINGIDKRQSCAILHMGILSRREREKSGYRSGAPDSKMTQSRMEWVVAPSAPWIDFNIFLDGEDIINQLAFVVLLAAKFDGEIKPESGPFERGDGYVFGSLRVLFESRVQQQNAKAHCRGHLDENGVVNPSYVGALKYADPGLREAQALRKKIGDKNSN